MTAARELVILLNPHARAAAWPSGLHLGVSETTVKTHVTRILTKLDLRDRVQVVVLAYEAGVIVPGLCDQV
jgi:hypothetical protein